MLSYRHAFHAGNFADVLKHWVQVEILHYLRKKEKPFLYIDTHAGAGCYALDSSEANKTQEHTTGISALNDLAWPALSNYLAAVQQINQQQQQENLYPGSPALAQTLLRADDKAELFELHPNDFLRLQEFMRGDRRIKVHQQDGFSGLLSKLPPTLKRGLVLIDPPYEIKTDYQQVVDTLVQAYRKCSTLTYALWYPVVERQRIDQLEAGLKDSGIANIYLCELAIKADTSERGMTAAGMIVINPPWTLASTAEALLPQLSALLGKGQGAWRSVELVAETSSIRMPKR